MNLAIKLAARRAAGKPIRIALIGAGKFGTMILGQLGEMQSIQLCVLADLNIDRAIAAATRAGWSPERFAVAESPSAANDLARCGRAALVP